MNTAPWESGSTCIRALVRWGRGRDGDRLWGGLQTGCDLKIICADFVFAGPGKLDFRCCCHRSTCKSEKAADRLRRLGYRCPNKHNLKPTVTGAQGSWELAHRFGSSTFVRDKTPGFRPRPWNICLLSRCLGGFRVPIFSSRNVFFNENTSNSIGSLVYLAGEQKISKQKTWVVGGVALTA